MTNVKIHNDDCFNVFKKIKDKEIDMYLLDPPYGMNFNSGYRKEKHKKIINDDCMDWLNNLASEMYRTAKDNTAHYVFCSFHNVDKFKQAFEQYFKIKNILIWEKNNTSMGDLKADFAPKYEMIIFLQKGRRFINGSRDPNILKFNRTGNKLHPTQKPVDMLEYLIEKFSDNGGTIADPFMGSGSTGVAAINKGRNFLGVEIDCDYFYIAKNRIYEAKNKIIKSLTESKQK
jgi:site-specific DNA-methyltransferase (adenine-specific)